MGQMMGHDWPLIDSDEPMERLVGYAALMTGCYWLIAPLIVLAELITELVDDLLGPATETDNRGDL